MIVQSKSCQRPPVGITRCIDRTPEDLPGGFCHHCVAHARWDGLLIVRGYGSWWYGRGVCESKGSPTWLGIAFLTFLMSYCEMESFFLSHSSFCSSLGITNHSLACVTTMTPITAYTLRQTGKWRFCTSRSCPQKVVLDCHALGRRRYQLIQSRHGSICFCFWPVNLVEFLPRDPCQCALVVKGSFAIVGMMGCYLNWN